MAQAIYFTQSEAALFLRLSERTLERWRVEGQGPRFRRFRRRVVYAKNDLETWADDRCYQSTSATEPLQV
jgi:Helix-turn-helix domain